MRYTFVRLFISLLFIIFLVLPVSVSGSTVPDISQFDSTFPEQIQPIDTSPATAPAVIVSDASIRSTSAVTVDEENPTANLNSGAFGSQLRVGSTSEFGYTMWSLISFSPLKQSEGGPIPDGATIRGAKLKLYKDSDGAGTINVYRLSDGFNENTVNWDTMPGKWATAEGTKSVSSSTGWVEIDIAEAMIINALNFNRPVRMVLCPTWEGSPSLVFKSDEHSSRGPILVVSYEGAPPPPEPTPPEPPADDTTPCTIEYTVSPSHPHVGDRVTITITARDDQAMWYLALSRGYEELGRINATTPGDRELRIEYSEAATLPSMSFIITADDLGDAPPAGETISIPVIGSGTPPEVTVTADWEIERVVPEEYQLIKNDGQTVTITATATDPDGIDLMSIFINGIAHDFRYSGETSVSETFVWTNNEPTRTRFSYYAGARDEEGSYVTAEGGNYVINHPEDIRFMWSAALGFHNPSTPTLSWERMVQIFGSGECWNVKSWGWRDPSADRFYEDNIRTVCDGGECFGMSTTATEIYHGRISPSELEFPLIAKQLSDANSFTREYVQARQGGQMSEEVLVPRHNQEGVGIMEILRWIEDDLENDDPGVLDIWEGSSGHSVVPWMTRHMPDDTVRVYIYDCNREAGVRNPNADFHSTLHYPYIVFDDSGWSYQMSSTSVWDDEIDYINYRDACGDMDQLVSPSLGTDAPLLTDHDIPTASDFWHGVVGGDVDVYFEDEEGNITGIYNGEIREEIPNSMVLMIPMGSPFSEHESYILPMDKELSIHAVGQQEGEYNFSLLGGNSLFSIQKKRIAAGSDDTLSISPAGAMAIGHKFRIQPDTADDNFRVLVAIRYAGLVAALDSEEIEREYGMEEVSASEDSDFAVQVEEGGGTLVIDNYGDGIEFDATMRSTESADSIDPDEELPYIPSSTEEDVTLGRGQRLEATPDDWATADDKGSLHTLKKKAEGGGNGGTIPFIPIVIGVVVVVAVAGGAIYFINKRSIGKSA